MKNGPSRLAGIGHKGAEMKKFQSPIPGRLRKIRLNINANVVIIVTERKAKKRIAGEKQTGAQIRDKNT